MCSFQVGDTVQLTAEGARIHRRQKKAKTVLTGAAIVGTALPLAVPGAIGVAIAGGAVRIGIGAQAVIGGAAGAGAGGIMNGLLGRSPEAGAIGVVIEVKARTFHRPGCLYLIEWRQPEAYPSSWHLTRHLTRVN